MIVGTGIGICGLSNLTDLDISCSIFGEADRIGELTNLKRLNLYYHISVTDSDLMRLTKLEKLILGGRDSLVTSDGVSGLIHLTRLEMTETGDSVIDKGLSSLANLRTLLLSSCDVTDNGIMPLTKLTKLSAGEGTWVTDSGISGLTRLTKLNLYRNTNPYITSAGLNKLSNLTFLGLSKSSRIELNALAPLIEQGALVGR